MAMRKIISVICALVGFCVAASAQKLVLDSDNAVRYEFKDGRDIDDKSVLNVRQTEQGRVYDVEVFKGDRSQYAVGLSFVVDESVARGDVLLASVTLRTIYARQETGECAAFFMFQEPAPRYTKSFSTAIGCDSEWTTFNVPFRAHMDFDKGVGRVELALGALAQRLEIRSLRIIDYGPDYDMASLPVTRFTYAGREEGAQWREDALQRIENLRTSMASVKVVDARGRAVKGAKVHVNMLKSDFIWGCSVGAPSFYHDNKIDSTYAANLKRSFNTAVIGSGLKAGGWSEPKRREATVHTFNWLYDNGFGIRGHNLVWPGWKFNHRATRAIADQNPEMFGDFIKAQFLERMTFTNGRVIAWDVVNEPMHERDFFKILDEDKAMVEWFQLAKTLDPQAQLFINEYSMLNCVQSAENVKAYIAMIQNLRSKGAPIEAIGVQGHIGTQPRAPQLVLSDLDLFVPLGLPVQITEWDVNTKDEELQADYSRDFLIAMYSHPVVSGVTMWGFWEGDHWKKDAALYRTDWSPKPNAAVWDELVLDKWKTDVRTRTDVKGCTQVRAHHGTYEIEVEYKGQKIVKQCHVGTDGLSLTLQLE